MFSKYVVNKDPFYCQVRTYLVIKQEHKAAIVDSHGVVRKPRRLVLTIPIKCTFHLALNLPARNLWDNILILCLISYFERLFGD